MSPKVFIAKAPAGYTKKRIITILQLDPYQTRVSQNPIVLTNPRTGKSAVLKEYIDEVDLGSRFAIEGDDGLIFVSRVYNSAIGYIFLPVGEGHFKYD